MEEGQTGPCAQERQKGTRQFPAQCSGTVLSLVLLDKLENITDLQLKESQCDMAQLTKSGLHVRS